MKTFIIGDTHFNHKNIIQLCNRPFPNINAMNEALIKNWNRVVGKGDIVYTLGDFALCNKEKIAYFLERLNGSKYLVKGNHDGYSIKTYMDLGFEKVYDKPIIYKDFYIFSHEPMFITNEMPYANCYAHVHNDPRYVDYSVNTFCASAERIGFTPIEIDKAIALMCSCEESS